MQQVYVCVCLYAFYSFFPFHASRLQHSNTSEPPEKAPKLQGHTWDVAKFDEVIVVVLLILSDILSVALFTCSHSCPL